MAARRTSIGGDKNPEKPVFHSYVRNGRGADHVDLFYVHRRDADTPIEEVADTLAGLVKSGKTRSFGFSEIAPSSLHRASRLHHVAAVQSEYSLSVRAPELGLTQATAALDTALVAFSPVGRSLLTDKPHDAAKAATMPFLKENPRFQEPNLSENIRLTAAFRDLAADLGISAAGLSIAWLLHQQDNVIPIPGTRSPAHLRELCAGARLALGESDLAASVAAGVRCNAGAKLIWPTSITPCDGVIRR